MKKKSQAVNLSSYTQCNTHLQCYVAQTAKYSLSHTSHYKLNFIWSHNLFHILSPTHTPVHHHSLCSCFTSLLFPAQLSAPLGLIVYGMMAWCVRNRRTHSNHSFFYTQCASHADLNVFLFYQKPWSESGNNILTHSEKCLVFYTTYNNEKNNEE